MRLLEGGGRPAGHLELALDDDAAGGDALLEKVLSVVKGGSFDLKSLLGGNTSSILSKLDLGKLVKQTGIDQAKVEAGAKQVLPDLMKQLQSQSGGLEGLLGKIGGGTAGAGDLLKKAGKLFGGS